MAAPIYPQMVRIRNDGSTPFTAKYNGQRYTLDVNQDTFIPWDAMCLWFGHPHAVDVPGDKRKRYRTDELKRLYVKYGVYENHHLAAERFPKISVWDITDNHQIITVVNDPEGKALTPQDRTIADNESLQAQIKAMQEQMVVLAQQLKNNEAANNDVPNDDKQAFEPSNRPEIANDTQPIQPDPLAELPDDVPFDGPVVPKAVAKAS